MGIKKSFVTYGKIILAVDEIVSISIGKTNVTGMEGKIALRTMLKNGTEWATTFDSDEELLKAFGDVQRALEADACGSSMSMEDILSDKD